MSAKIVVPSPTEIEFYLSEQRGCDDETGYVRLMVKGPRGTHTLAEFAVDEEAYPNDTRYQSYLFRQAFAEAGIIFPNAVE